MEAEQRISYVAAATAQGRLFPHLSLSLSTRVMKSAVR